MPGWWLLHFESVRVHRESNVISIFIRSAPVTQPVDQRAIVVYSGNRSEICLQPPWQGEIVRNSRLYHHVRHVLVSSCWLTSHQVVGAKVVTNANRPGAKCYGYVTMSTHEEAAKCIQNLHRTELHGRMISVDRARNDPSAPTRPASSMN